MFKLTHTLKNGKARKTVIIESVDSLLQYVHMMVPCWEAAPRISVYRGL